MNTKICNNPLHLEELSISEFAKNKNNKDGYQKRCKKCQKEADSKYYKSSEKRRKNLRETSKKQEQILRDYVINYLLSHPCIDCGEKDIVVLEFDHNNSKEKTTSISIMVTHCVSLKKLKTEIEKCSIRCSNCHRRKTAKQFGHYKYLQGYLSGREPV